jgi:hypothetical protein
VIPGPDKSHTPWPAGGGVFGCDGRSLKGRGRGRRPAGAGDPVRHGEEERRSAILYLAQYPQLSCTASLLYE